MLPHQYVVDEAVPATCEHTGLSSGIHCASCHTVFLAQMETPMTDHAWGEPVYEWAEDYSTVTATRYCRHNESHMETETVAASGEITKAATCSEMGETTYTSEAFENAAFEAQSTVLANVEKIEHTPVTDEAVEPTCVAIGLTEGSHCEVCGEILVRQEPIGKLEHQYVVDEAVPATCEHTGLSSGIHCASCQTVFLAQTETPAIGHEWDEPAYTWTEDNGMVTASRVCLHDNSHSETETVAATAEVTKESTCSEMGETTYTSEIFENEAFAVQTKIVTDVEKTAHTPVIDEAVEPTQDSTGLTEGSHCAICGEILVAQEVIPALGDDQGTCGDNLTWRLNDEGLLTISGTGDMTDFSFQLITNYSYVIDSPWYEVRESIRTVVLENGVTSVGRNAFLNCSNLESVILPDSLAKIGPAAFCSCSSLSDIVIPKGITCLDDDLFYGCTNLARIEIPENVTRIGFCTFGECESLRSITIPNNVTIIDTAAFDACINLTNVILPDGINMISNGAFQRCRSLTSIVIPDGVLSISDNAFNNCESLSSITIPESVTAIGSNAFVVCSNLSSVYYSGTEEQWNEIEIGEGNELLNGAEIHYSDVEFRNILNLPATLTTIESEAFANLTNVDAIRIPESVVEIANDAFAGSDITIITPAGSYAEDWANNPEHEYPCITE
ncbi:MAG: leucine-rich repeat domain-containing protein [Clostridia bacterium]|nr:leucine-rich repeat domain-containing protein [Clostridia bacterium]